MNEWNSETAEWYANKYGEYATNRLGIEALELKHDSTIVDIGCGTGCALRHAALKVTHGTLIGIDPIPRMIEIAREQTTNHPVDALINYYVGRAENLPLEDNYADFVLAFDSYDHWQDHSQGLGEVSRIIKPNGCFMILKDGDLLAEPNAKIELLSNLNSAGFHVINEKSVESSGVTFSYWICVVRL